MWKGWTLPENAPAYDDYLRHELFPRLQQDLGQTGYKGFDVLSLKRETEVEFVTMVWFESIESVKGFAGDSYTTPVISPKAQSLLSRWQSWCDHYELNGTSVR